VLFIRGVGLDDFNSNSTSAVAVYQDGIYMNSPAGQLFQFFDTKGVQVLRGPHGGPYRNATGGAILVESAPPSFEPSAYATFTYGNYNLRDGEGALTGPLVSDMLAYRFSFKVIERGGFTKNRCDGVPLSTSNLRRDPCQALRFGAQSVGFPQKVPGRVNDASVWALRAQLLTADLQLGSTQMEWLLNGHFGRNDSGSYQYQQRGFEKPNPRVQQKTPGRDAVRYIDTDGEPFQGDYNFDGPRKLDIGGASLRGRWELSDTHELLSLSGYEWHDADTISNTDANPFNLASSRNTDETWQFSQDLRLTSEWSDSLTTIIGGYFLIEDLDAFNVFQQPQNLGGIQFDQALDQNTRGFAFFGDLTWEFLDGLTFHADVRFIEEYKKLSITAQSQNISAPTRVELLSGVANNTWRDLAGSVSLTWAITDEASVYVKYSHGFKPGHFNGGATVSRQIISPVDPETVDAYEVGARTEWFDGRLSLGGAFFYADYVDQQLFQFAVDQQGGIPLSQLINAQAARILGVEADLEVSPIDRLDIKLSMAFLDTKYDEFTNEFRMQVPVAPGEPPMGVDVLFDYTGNRLVGAPRWSAVGSIQYVIPLDGLASELTPRFSFTYKDKVFFDPAEGKGGNFDLPDDTLAQDGYWLLNANLAWRISTGGAGALEVSGWVRNLTNEEYRSQSFDVTGTGFGFVLDAYGPPRTYGITLRAEY
jgi:iron complex outermembrane receptor protein